MSLTTAITVLIDFGLVGSVGVNFDCIHIGLHDNIPIKCLTVLLSTIK